MFFWNSLAFSMIQQMWAIWSLVPLPFLKPAWTSGSSWFTYCLSLAWRILSITLLACEMSALCGSLSILILIPICMEWRRWRKEMSIQIFFPKNRKSPPPSRNTNGREQALNTFTQNSNKTLTESQELGILTLY